MQDHYQTLGIEKSATPSDIRAAFKKSVLKWHPDRLISSLQQQQQQNQENQEEKQTQNNREDFLLHARRMFDASVAAANCLLDSQAKARYDAFMFGAKAIDVAGKISETCSLKEEFEIADDHDDDDDEDGEERKEKGISSSSSSSDVLYVRECRCGGTYSIIFINNKKGDEKEDDEKKSNNVRKFSSCDSCSLVIEVICDT